VAREQGIKGYRKGGTRREGGDDALGQKETGGGNQSEVKVGENVWQ